MALQELRTTLDNNSATADEIKTKLDTLRQIKAKRGKISWRRKTDLKTVLTQRQEAVLVIFGLLD